MKKNLSWLLATCIAVVATGCVQQQFRAIEVDGEFLVSPTLDMATPRANRRTWIVYDTDLIAEMERHFQIGDGLRIKARLGEFRLEPLRRLRGRWNWETKPSNHYIVLVRSTEIDNMLCGEIQLAGHESGAANHLLRITSIPSNTMLVTLGVFNEDVSIEKQCNDSQPTHRGRVHLEN